MAAAAAGLNGNPAAGADAQLPTLRPDDAITRELDRLISTKKAVGVAVGLTGPSGRRFISQGRRSGMEGGPPAVESVFQIASVTKTFTGALLINMVESGEVALDEPVAKLLPKGTEVPQLGARQITLLDLATHTSGLPRDPYGFDAPDGGWEGFTDAVLLRLLPTWRLAAAPGATYGYSNTGVSLLALALRRRSGERSYEDLLRKRVLNPLGLHNTRVHPTASMKRRLVTGFDDDLKPAPLWRMDQAIAGVGGLYSTTDDLLTYLEARIAPTSLPIGSALKAQLSVRRPKPHMPADEGAREVAIGWHIDHRPRGDVIWHDGHTSGYSAFAGWNPDAKTGVVILANISGLDVVSVGSWALGAKLTA